MGDYHHQHVVCISADSYKTVERVQNMFRFSHWHGMRDSGISEGSTTVYSQRAGERTTLYARPTKAKRRSHHQIAGCIPLSMDNRLQPPPPPPPPPLATPQPEGQADSKYL